jgi:hypothetical protein
MAARCSEWNCFSSFGSAVAAPHSQAQPTHVGPPPDHSRGLATGASVNICRLLPWSRMRTQELCLVVDAGGGGPPQLCQVALVGRRHVGEDPRCNVLRAKRV